MAGGIHEKCAVAGALTTYPNENSAVIVKAALASMQHRGEGGTGISSIAYETGRLATYRGPGFVEATYTDENLSRLSGALAIGHNRYATSGGDNHPQPIDNELTGTAFACNGNLPDTDQLEKFLEPKNLITTDSNDSELMAYTIDQFVQEGLDLPDAIERTYPMFIGAFSCVALRDELVAFRDPCGIRPLSLGMINGDSRGVSGYIFASETCALDDLGAEHIRDVDPGEMVIIERNGNIESRQLAEANPKLDIFEIFYFAKEKSRLHGQSVASMRRKIGEQLAAEHPIEGDNVLVVGVPDSGTPVAEGYADALGLRHQKAITRDRYYPGRSFMQTTQTLRRQLVRYKLDPIPDFIKGKDIVLVDDSIVRGTTAPELLRQVEACQPSSISMLVGSPPVRYPDYYGINIPRQDELIAANFTVEQIRKEFGLKELGYISLRGLIKAIGVPADKFNLSCFTGEYPIDIGRRWREIHTPVSMEYVD